MRLQNTEFAAAPVQERIAYKEIALPNMSADISEAFS
jgi:hypothetical protein